MRKLNFFKTLLVAVGLCAGVNAWAVDIPTPVYFNDFSSSDGLTIVGSGEFIEDADSRFGKIYHNDPSLSKAVRTNYLQLPASVLTHSKTTQEMTIGFWVNVKDAAAYFYSPIFSAYASKSTGDNGTPMFVCQSRGLLQLNCWGWTDFLAAQNDKGANAESTSWLDDKSWHYYTVTLTSTTAKVYIDGAVVNSWTMDGTSDGQVIAGLFNGGAENALPYVCLGGNQAWGWNDPDPAYGFDDFVVYDVALSSEQIAKIMAGKLNNDITALPFNKTWTSGDTTSPFSGGSVKTGTNITALSVNNTTATAYFDSDTDTDGRQAYTLATDEEVTITLTAYHGWLSNGTSQGVKLLNSGGYTLAEYVYNVKDCNITDVKIGGSTASDFTAAYNCQSKFNDTKGANGFTNNPYVNTAGWNPTITFKVRSDGYVTLNISMSGKNIDNTYTGQLPAGWNVDIASIQAYALSNNDDRTLAINNLSITSAVAARADYTVKYVDNESNKIDQDVVYSGVIGTKPTLISADKANRYNAAGTLKYVYASDDASSKTIALDGSTVVTVMFTSLGKFDYSVTTSNGVTIDSGSLFEDETKVVSWSKYIEKDGDYYQATAPFQFTVTKDETSHEVSVTESQVTQFLETTSSNWASTGVENSNLSGGIAYRGLAMGATRTMLTVAETGVYSINYAVFSTNTGSGKEFDFSLYKNDASDESNLIETFSVNHSVNYVHTTGTRTIENILLLAGDEIIAKSGNTTCALDYIALAKTGDATVSKTISAAGYATYCSPYALDFSSVTGLTAYIAAKDGTKVKFTPVDNVPANTGVLLKGAEGNYSIPVIASSTTDVEDNILTGVLANTSIAVGDYGYVLMNVSNVVGFYKTDTTKGFTVGANTAYIKSDKGLSRMFISFDDDEMETTGINEVKTIKANNAIYNLKGMKVKTAQKGLYIINGKKVVK